MPLDYFVWAIVNENRTIVVDTGFERSEGDKRGRIIKHLPREGLEIIGIDAYTLDRPFADMVADYRRTGDGRYIWPAHFAGLEAEYCQIEKLANLGQLPQPRGFWVSCLPVKIAHASAGWCRAVAFVPSDK